MNNFIIGINTILHTKDGSKIGNAIVTGNNGASWEITTDYGNKFTFTNKEIDEYFNVAWCDFNKEEHGYSCQEMQEMMASGHIHRVVV